MPPHQHEQQYHPNDGAQNSSTIILDCGIFSSYSSSELQETTAAKRRRSTTPCTPTSGVEEAAATDDCSSSSRKRRRQTSTTTYQEQQQQQHRKLQRRTVTFGAPETTIVQHIPNARDELSKEERRTVYLSRGELRRTRNEILNTLRHFKDLMLHCNNNNSYNTNCDRDTQEGPGAHFGLPSLSDHETSDDSNGSNSESSDDEKKQTATNSHSTTTTATTATTTTTEYCLRGLETYLPIVKQERVQRVAGALQAILMEQQHQRRMNDIAGATTTTTATTTTGNRRSTITTTGTLHSGWIHAVYLPMTAESKKLALLAGFYDEDAVNDS
jgi:hypothetical protein